MNVPAKPAREVPASPDRAAPHRGELRIYLGAAPGVGKTYAMLGEARRRRDRGTDVVVAVAETYGRARTEDLLDGLDQLPRAGAEGTEMDVDAVLARKPEVAVVDELAHGNGPGARNETRCQDVEELLAAGITVLTTVNVEQLQSLGDVIERITGVRPAGTVPDEVVRNAEQVELIDITPEALRRRLAHGNVYPAERIDAALGNYFRVGTLTALRELALLWLADQVDVALQRYRAEQEITETWEIRERVVVAISGGPESETLIRRARRIAARAGADLLVLHILRGDSLAGRLSGRLSGQSPARLAALRKVAEQVGATFHTVVGDDVRRDLLHFARGVNATQLVLGTSRRSRFARFFDEGIGATVVQLSGPIDVHLVTHEEAGHRLRNWLARAPLSSLRQSVGWVLAIALPVLATLAGELLRPAIDFATNVVTFVLATVLVAFIGGVRPALASAILSAHLLAYFFAEPYYRLAVSSPRVLVTLAATLVVSVLVALAVGVAARRASLASQARKEASLLASYARTVLSDAEPLERLLQKVRENFGQVAVGLMEKRFGHWHRVAEVGSRPCAEPDQADVDIPVTGGVHLTLRGRSLPAADRGVVETVAGQALLAWRQQQLSAATAEAERKAQATELRTALLSAVGHDLRTPLTSIKASISSLRAPDLELSTTDTQELMETIELSTDRLAGLVDNLLDSSRLATGAVRPDVHPVGYDEVVARALSNVDNSGAVRVDVAEDLPWVLADPGLLERVIANVVDNALRHGTGGEVDVRASAYAEQVELRVVDHGPGLPKGAAEGVFVPFQRGGDRERVPGIGLGLYVAKGFTEAMGGTIRAEDTPGGGLTVVLSLRAEGAQP